MRLMYKVAALFLMFGAIGVLLGHFYVHCAGPMLKNYVSHAPVRFKEAVKPPRSYEGADFSLSLCGISERS